MAKERAERLLMSPEQYKKVQEIYLHLLDLPESKRKSALLDQNLEKEIEQEVLALLSNTSEETILDHNKVNIQTKVAKAETKRSFRSILSSASLTFRSYIVIGLVLIISLGIWTHNRVKWQLQDIRQSELSTGVESLRQSMELWVNDFKHDVSRLSSDKELRMATIELLKEVENSDSLEYIHSDIHLTILSILQDLVDSNRYNGYAIIDRKGISVSSSEIYAIGLELNNRSKGRYFDILDGNTRFDPPFLSSNKDAPDDSKIFREPNVWVHVPIKDLQGKVIAAFSACRPAHNEFSNLLKVNRLGNTGESYIINKVGLMLSESRNGEDLTRLKLVENEESKGMLELMVKDPGVNLLSGETPVEAKDSWRLTKAAQTITSLALDEKEEYGISLQPYNDYRGVPVIGSWVWIPKYEFGIITEMDVSEAYSALPYLSNAFALLTLIMAGLFIYSSIKTIRVQALTKQITESQVGNYTLEKKIGEGGMSKVYLASHHMLKRPTAIKVLKEEVLKTSALERFKEEVKNVSRLRHPNTISIYDYGETEQGVFYYAMEFLDGLTVKEIVKMNGNMPIGRAIHTLLYACYSLKEAHDLNLIHRDVKPQNIMLCVQGGIYDMVKVLDFGLVKDMESNDRELTRQAEITGTPLYMAPERITNPSQADQRSDIYAIAAVGYYLLSGTPLFEYKNDLDVMASIINTTPEPLQSLRPEIPQLLSNLIHVCLDKDADERPERVDYLIGILEDLRLEHPWSREEAKSWWMRFKG